ncbi:MAG: acyl-CoA dehydrogenase family protein [Thermoprotei archaeon]
MTGSEESLILKSLGELTKRFSERADRVDREGVFPAENIGELAANGYLTAFTPKPYGLGLGFPLYMDVVREVAKACASTAWLYVTHCAATQSLYVCGTEAQRERFLREADSGRLMGLAATEVATGAGIAGMETKAEPRGDVYVLNGTKSFITGAHGAHTFIVVARMANSDAPFPKNLSAFIVERGVKGFSVGQRFEPMGMRGIGWGELVFNDCEVPKENMIPDGVRAINSGGHVGMLGAAAISFGLAEAAFDVCRRHVKERLVGGQALGQREGVKAMLSEMGVTLEAMKHTLRFGLDALARDSYPDLLKVKGFVTENALKVLDLALRITGAHGYSRLLPLERYYRDARAPLLHFQTLETGRNVLGSILQQ